jgi:hypothetical protein
MSSFLITFAITAFVLLAVFGLMGIKVLLKPGGEFKKNCGNFEDKDGCSHCGRPSGDVCDEHNTGGCNDHGKANRIVN